MAGKIILLRDEGELLRRLAEEARATPGSLLRKLILSEALRRGLYEPRGRNTQTEEVVHER
jgi:hypothetical protein